MGCTDLAPPYSASPAPSFSSFSSNTSSVSYDPYVDLGRLLARLEQNLLRADSDRWRRLVTDEFQRLQARFDVAAARKLLTRVEQSALSIKVLSRRHEVQAELNRRRALVELLQERLDNLDDEARAAAAFNRGAAVAGEEEKEDGDSEDGGDGDDDTSHIVRSIRGAGSTQHLSVQTAQPQPIQQPELATPTSAETETAPTPTSTSQPRKPRRRKTNRVRIAAPGDGDDGGSARDAPTTTAMTTRSRRRQQAKEAVDDAGIAGEADGATQTQDTARTTSASLFDRSGDGESAGVATEEAVLDHHRREQEVLSEDILRLAQALKEKSLLTSRMLEDDKDVVDRVGEGMNTTTDSLSAASRSMAVLSRMTEGKGWWGRMLLLGMVYGSMLALLLLFLFLPKLRL
ncbi:uncharacterized protein SPSK_02573 [Sporothrix schenckii 1099-18]|uniref:t-SNARE coiled-coil homology domain-containing protein n=2 Tax=Sporothrix schenckii TaxID=29908 RepID=U7PN42_SPOS1|nr:uncharacterized protein SPSK_02573 [Sporothrix schenckii 1099-18]ERS96992.1 hypothetical protein HMPREF1624_06319 [Sporothrix schenckii ATCC 58251]KJR86184.1 hypothetical protein SPSK_02573 [Sporothrix schenckii 1099-18]